MLEKVFIAIPAKRSNYGQYSIVKHHFVHEYDGELIPFCGTVSALEVSGLGDEWFNAVKNGESIRSIGRYEELCTKCIDSVQQKGNDLDKYNFRIQRMRNRKLKKLKESEANQQLEKLRKKIRQDFFANCPDCEMPLDHKKYSFNELSLCNFCQANWIFDIEVQKSGVFSVMVHKNMEKAVFNEAIGQLFWMPPAIIFGKRVLRKDEDNINAVISKAEEPVTNNLHVHKYSEEHLLNALRELAKIVRRIPVINDLNPHMSSHQKVMPAPNTYKKRFGSFDQALIKAGLIKAK